MERRELLAALGVGAVGLLTAGDAAARDQHEHDHDEHVDTLSKCARICNEAAHHCLGQLRKGGQDADHHARAHELTMDCQAYCTLTAALMARHSPTVAYAHRACADACRDCAEECDKGQGAIMKECAQACRACEKVCREMAKHDGGRGTGPR